MDPATPPAGTIAVRAQSATFSGPLPPPELLIRYNDAVPDAADRILRMAEQQSAHRQDLERRVVASDIRKSYLGLGAAFALALASIICGSLVTYTGQPIAGTVIATGAVVSLVVAFLKGTGARQEERTEKAKNMSPARTR